MEDFFARIGTEWQIGFHEKLEKFYHRLYKCCKTFGTLFLKCSGSGYRKVASSRLSVRSIFKDFQTNYEGDI